MSFMMYDVECEKCSKKMRTSFGIVGTTQIATPIQVCPDCGGKVRKPQPKEKLDLAWSAYFSDGSHIFQFDDADQTVEHRFAEVLDKNKTEDLIEFHLTNLRTLQNYRIDLIHGRIIVEPGETLVKSTRIDKRAEQEVSGNSQYKYRLIYFRRVTRQISWQGAELSPKGSPHIIYFLGYQYTDESGKNHKRIMQITKDDEVIAI